MTQSLSSTFTGRVVSVNDKGLKLEGHDEWANRSKFAPEFPMPVRGDTVTITVDGKGFLRSCDVVAGTNGSGASPAAPSAPGASSSAQKDRTITRLAVLKAASEFGASRPELKSGDVLKIAASWERWVNRPDDPTEDNVDAF